MEVVWERIGGGLWEDFGSIVEDWEDCNKIVAELLRIVKGL